MQLTSFVGRQQEIDQISTALSAGRLVTLYGPGGVGKTRLALTAAAQALDRYGDGVFLVELAPLSDPALVTQQVLSAVGLVEESRPPRDTLVDHLRDRRVLLVLDNCEHLLSACALLVDTLLPACPELHVLATSREPLRTPARRRSPWRRSPCPDRS